MTQHRITLTIKGVTLTSGLGRSTIYNLIGSGELDAVKAGGRTLVMVESLNRYIANLPKANITTGRIS